MRWHSFGQNFRKLTGRILCKNVAGEDRLRGLEMDGYKTKNNSSENAHNM